MRAAARWHSEHVRELIDYTLPDAECGKSAKEEYVKGAAEVDEKRREMMEVKDKRKQMQKSLAAAISPSSTPPLSTAVSLLRQQQNRRQRQFFLTRNRTASSSRLTVVMTTTPITMVANQSVALLRTATALLFKSLKNRVEEYVPSSREEDRMEQQGKTRNSEGAI
ncbi:unnamed protein product [Litomosoides sigmodontis]|uniref:Uncharacterized protein n=1 Tax=Litomosoides sigmodontis TaxID=42156 RepID=A0A3P6SSI2_LITSI|nr:unnamed protein product [Litomosoides sigmodontis]